MLKASLIGFILVRNGVIFFFIHQDSEAYFDKNDEPINRSLFELQQVKISHLRKLIASNATEDMYLDICAESRTKEGDGIGIID